MMSAHLQKLKVFYRSNPQTVRMVVIHGLPVHVNLLSLTTRWRVISMSLVITPTGGLCSSCAMIILRKNRHGEIVRKALPMYVVNLKMTNSPK